MCFNGIDFRGGNSAVMDPVVSLSENARGCWRKFEWNARLLQHHDATWRGHEAGKKKPEPFSPCRLQMLNENDSGSHPRGTIPVADSPEIAPARLLSVTRNKCCAQEGAKPVAISDFCYPGDLKGPGIRTQLTRDHAAVPDVQEPMLVYSPSPAVPTRFRQLVPASVVTVPKFPDWPGLLG